MLKQVQHDNTFWTAPCQEISIRKKAEQLIISVAAKLFLEKGYENISLNDIIKNLGGLTKGAIYSHFKSKEEIYQAVIYQMSASSDDAIEEIIKSDQLNGGRIDYSKNPRMLYALLLELKDEVAPLFIYDCTI